MSQGPHDPDGDDQGRGGPGEDGPTPPPYPPTPPPYGAGPGRQQPGGWAPQGGYQQGGYQQGGYPHGGYQQGGYQQGGYPNPYAPYGVHPMTGVPYSDKTKLVAGLLQILIPIGIGRFYLGDTKTGVWQLVLTLVTCGLGSLWPFIDGIIILATDNVTDAEGRPLRMT